MSTVPDKIVQGQTCPHVALCKRCYAGNEAFEAMREALRDLCHKANLLGEMEDAPLERARTALALADKVGR